MFICKQGRGAPSPFADPVLRNVPRLARQPLYSVVRAAPKQ